MRDFLQKHHPQTVKPIYPDPLYPELFFPAQSPFMIHPYISTHSDKLKILFTAAITDFSNISREERRDAYATNLQLLQQYGCEIFTVEACQSTWPTYLDDYCDKVLYTRSNNPLCSKSFNEMLSMKIGFDYYQWDPEELVIKMTGRYIAKTDAWISFVNEHKDADIIARVWDDKLWAEYDAYTGYFAMKGKYFNEFLDWFFHHWPDLPDGYCEEHALGEFIDSKKDTLNIVYIPRLFYQEDAVGRM
jgi:hypothetical protein